MDPEASVNTLPFDHPHRAYFSCRRPRNWSDQLPLDVRHPIAARSPSSTPILSEPEHKSSAPKLRAQLRDTPSDLSLGDEHLQLAKDPEGNGWPVLKPNLPFANPDIRVNLDRKNLATSTDQSKQADAQQHQRAGFRNGCFGAVYTIGAVSC